MDLIFNEETQKWEEKKEPFAVIEVETEEDFNRLRELVEADRDGRCSISPKLACMDEVSTPTPEQYRWMMGRFLKGDQDG